jgi:predicted nuclease of predicted toxin-antitoxin system
MTISGPRFLADENFNNDRLRALLRHRPDLDIVRVQDTAIAGADDPAVLAWAAEEGRILLTHDVRTIPRFAYVRVRAGQPMPGVVEVAGSADLGDALDDLLVLITASRDDEWTDQARFVPLR